MERAQRSEAPRAAAFTSAGGHPVYLSFRPDRTTGNRPLVPELRGEPSRLPAPSPDRLAELRTLAAGVHDNREGAEDYGHREGPMIVVAPDGAVFNVERDPSHDEKSAADECRFEDDRARFYTAR
ncbi:MAG TPA: hypothetical protein VGF17_24850 [Phytomonospora sp.]